MAQRRRHLPLSTVFVILLALRLRITRGFIQEALLKEFIKNNGIEIASEATHIDVVTTVSEKTEITIPFTRKRSTDVSHTVSLTSTTSDGEQCSDNYDVIPESAVSHRVTEGTGPLNFNVTVSISTDDILNSPLLRKPSSDDASHDATLSLCIFIEAQRDYITIDTKAPIVGRVGEIKLMLFLNILRPLSVKEQEAPPVSVVPHGELTGGGLKWDVSVSSMSVAPLPESVTVCRCHDDYSTTMGDSGKEIRSLVCQDETKVKYNETGKEGHLSLCLFVASSSSEMSEPPAFLKVIDILWVTLTLHESTNGVGDGIESSDMTRTPINNGCADTVSAMAHRVHTLNDGGEKMAVTKFETLLPASFFLHGGMLEVSSTLSLSWISATTPRGIIKTSKRTQCGDGEQSSTQPGDDSDSGWSLRMNMTLEPFLFNDTESTKDQDQTSPSHKLSSLKTLHIVTFVATTVSILFV